MVLKDSERSKMFFVFVLHYRFGRKLSIIRGIVEQEIQAMVSNRENIATHHSYQAWDPVPSLSPATTGMEEGLLSPTLQGRNLGSWHT